MCLFIGSPEKLQKGIFGVAAFQVKVNEISTFLKEIFIFPIDSSESEEFSKRALMFAAFVVC